MSDNFDKVSRRYMENVWENRARSVGLFPIPEYPEYEAERGMWSTALDVLLTTLRYIAPATLLTLFWGQQSFLFKLLKYIDSAVRSLLFSSEEQKQAVLQWLEEAGPVRVDKLDVVWRHGWIVCGVLDAALPGACAGHPPTRLSLKHAQAIADNYLGVEPVFSRQELESNDSLSRHQEWKLISYLDSIRSSLAKLSPPPKPINLVTHKQTTESAQFTLDYIARGSGLIAAQIKTKAYFKIYPTAQQSLDPGEINILIHGPKNIYGMTVLPPVLGKAQTIRQNLLGLQSKTSYAENILPITQGVTYLRSYGNNNLNKTFYIPKTQYDIDIDTEIKKDHARIGYIAILEGKYEISITSRGKNVVGSPFTVTAANNIVGSLAKDNFSLEDGEEIDIVDVKTDRKVVLRIVDFVTEKMLLKENGTFEKISDEEARRLMQTEIDKSLKNKNEDCVTDNDDVKKTSQHNKLFDVAYKVLTLNRICKIFQNLRRKNYNIELNSNNVDCRQNIPDILNSTICDDQIRNNLLEKQNIIISDNASVPVMKERSVEHTKETNLIDISDSLENYILRMDLFDDDTVSVDTVQSSINPFVDDIYDDNYTIRKDIGSLFPNEYETNNSQNEETETLTSKLLIDRKFESNNIKINPFIDDINLERPKTPVYRIISGEIVDRDQSVYVNPEKKIISTENLCGSYTNPFLKLETESTNLYYEKPDFIIGAPVSLPPVNFVTSIPSNKENDINKIMKEKTDKIGKEKDTVFCLADPIIKGNSTESKELLDDHSFSSLDSNVTQEVIIIPRSSPTLSATSQTQGSREISPKKDTWDSAYVSIDDSNCLSENNLVEIGEKLMKRNSPLSEDFSKMGPAERDIWENDSTLQDINFINDDYKLYKYDFKRPEFTPILEENEKNIMSSLREDTNINKTDIDSVAETFAELKDIYNDCYTNSEINSVTTNQELNNQNLAIDYALEKNDTRVDSASAILSDVKRQAKIFEGEISEVQDATESCSVSQHLPNKDNELNNNIIREHQEQNSNIETQFGNQIYANIVLEKKKYWDDRIRQIEAKSEEIRCFQNKRKLTAKHSKRNDSLSKRKGRKIVQQLLKTNHENGICSKSGIQIDPTNIIAENTNIKLNKPNLITHFETANKTKESLAEPVKITSCGKLADIICENEVSNQTQELSEKVFQAFETSPKRFFGTSRKQILNKIDTFLGNPDDKNKIKKNMSELNHENGLVSSRISLFHSISCTEEKPRPRDKCKSMFNISNQERKISSDQTNTAQKNIIEENKDQRSVEYSPKSDIINLIPDTSIPIKEKRARMKLNINNRSFDETLCFNNNNTENSVIDVKKTIKCFNEQYNSQFQSATRKLKSISKSEMDIFNKSSGTTTDDDLDKHKSYDELPKISVKNFISLYEDVTKTSNKTSIPNSPKKYIPNVKPTPTVSSNSQVHHSMQGTTSNVNISADETSAIQLSPSKANIKSENSDFVNRNKTLVIQDSTIATNPKINKSLDEEVMSNEDKETNYFSLSDIEIEIIDNDSVKHESSPKCETAHLEYKSRFTKAKKFFQSLEELREDRRSNKLIKCEFIDINKSTESLETSKRPRTKSNIKKSNSMPSSEISKAWNQLQEQKDDSKKLVKISEKFNVDDLFEDVMEGRLSRQGSLRGIPHKKAVLETFRSMDNIRDCKLNSYEMAESQLSEFAKENNVRNAQTYLTEYPYLPTTDPSKYHSRLDVNASGLITFKELKKIPRRNSVPDLRLNATFTADL